jgi:hypothetical protein
MMAPSPPGTRLPFHVRGGRKTFKRLSEIGAVHIGRTPPRQSGAAAVIAETLHQLAEFLDRQAGLPQYRSQRSPLQRLRTMYRYVAVRAGSSGCSIT